MFMYQTIQSSQKHRFFKGNPSELFTQLVFLVICLIFSSESFVICINTGMQKIHKELHVIGPITTGNHLEKREKSIVIS